MREERSDLKKRIVAWLYPDMIQRMESLMQAQNMKNHTEFVSQAVDFYVGYLNTGNSTTFLSESLLGAIQGTLQSTENRVANNLFRLSVEISMMMHLLAANLDITDDELRGLRGLCVAEVKRTKGKITFDHAVEFQQGNDE